MLCFTCNKETKNPKFCSRSCSAIYTNQFKPKRQPEHHCKICNMLINCKRRYCDNCNPLFKTNYGKDITLIQAKYTKHHHSSAYALIRTRARAIAKKLNWNSCKYCGYDKHIEIAHIHPISNFDKNTKISIINHPTNLLPLCPNCHWEYDHKLIKVAPEGVKPS